MARRSSEPVNIASYEWEPPPFINGHCLDRGCDRGPLRHRFGRRGSRPSPIRAASLCRCFYLELGVIELTDSAPGSPAVVISAEPKLLVLFEQFISDHSDALHLLHL